MLTLVDGAVNEASIIEMAPSIVNKPLAGPITPLNETAFLVPLASREEMKEVCKLGSFKVITKDGPCTMTMAPWSAEIEADGRASGEGQWIHIWNLPFHAWCWNIICEVVRPVGELIALSQAPSTHKYFISVLVRRRMGVSLPFVVALSLGMRRYSVLIRGDHGVLSIFKRELGRYALTDDEAEITVETAGRLGARRGTHEISKAEKGKQPIQKEEKGMQHF